MSNHKGHIGGGIVAYIITFCGIIAFSSFTGKFPTIFACATNTLLIQTPELLANIEYAVRMYIPPIIEILQAFLKVCWPWLIIVTEWFLFSLAGAMFPDVDIKSKSQKYLYSFLLLMVLVLIGKKQFKVVALLSAISFMPIFSNHRGLFHRLWFVIALPFGLWCWISILFPYLSTPLFYNMLFFIGGAISHLWLDMGLRKMLRI
ncbi:MAG: metal-dependent hydrolase [Candidatus Babeliales bacterium]